MRDSRGELLAAAAVEFGRHGLQGARVGAIVARAGVNERMIYHHFGGKDGLYRAVFAEQRQAMAQMWFPILEQAAALEPAEGMRRALAGAWDAFRAHPVMVALLMHETLGGWPSPFPTAEVLPTPMRELYARGQRAGVFPAAVAFELAYATAMGSLFSLAVFWPRFAEGIGATLEAEPALIRRQIVDQLVDGMTGTRSASAS